MRPRGRGSRLASGLSVVAHLRRGTDLDVYDAWDEARGCRVVVKALRPDRSEAGEAAARLRAEGRLLLRLAHPHLVRAYDLREDPRPLLVLETLRGRTIGALLDEEVLAPADAAVLGLQVGSALAYLHAHDRVHLDVKPSNVVAEHGRATLLDLSVARRPGRVTPGYGTWCSLAPEQARGDHAGPAADVWGLALLLHECVTGEPAFDVDGDTAEHPQLHRPAPAARTGTPLDALLAAALDPDPAARPALAEVLSGLEALGGSPRG